MKKVPSPVLAHELCDVEIELLTKKKNICISSTRLHSVSDFKIR